MKLYLIFVLITSVLYVVHAKPKKIAKIYALDDDSINTTWTGFKKNHKKAYQNKSHHDTRLESILSLILFLIIIIIFICFSFRKNTFKKNLQKINAHNKNYNNGSKSHSLSLNHFGDLV